MDSPISPAAEILQSLQPTTKTCHTIVRTARNAENCYAPNVQTGIARCLAKPHVICMLEGCQVIVYILVRPSKPSTSIIITLYSYPPQTPEDDVNVAIRLVGSSQFVDSSGQRLPVGPSSWPTKRNLQRCKGKNESMTHMMPINWSSIMCCVLTKSPA